MGSIPRGSLARRPYQARASLTACDTKSEGGTAYAYTATVGRSRALIGRYTIELAIGRFLLARGVGG